MLAGLIIGVPAWSIAAGQFCSGTVILHKVQLTVRSATASGTAVTPPAGAMFYVISSDSDAQGVTASAYNYCEGCTEADQVLTQNLTRQP